MKDKILLHFNKVEADKKISILNATKNDLQSLCGEFTALNPSLTISIEEVKTLFAEITDPQATVVRPTIKSFILNKLLPDGKLNGLPVNYETYERLFELPNTDRLVKKIQNVYRVAIDFLNAGFYTMEAGKVVIAPGSEEQIIESYKTYAETDKEIERYEKAKVLVSALNDVCILANNELNAISDLEMVVEFDEAGQFTFNSDFVKSGNVGQYQRIHQFLHLNNPKPEPEPAPIPGNGFSNEFLKQMGLGRPQDPTPEPDYSPDYFKTK